jgi:hypothetical protein
MRGMPRHRLLLALLVAGGALALPGAASAATPTVWLCKPGLRDNPCAPRLTTTRLAPDGRVLGVRRVQPARRPKVDCFYVYPTVSDQPGPQASLRVDPEQRSIARYQAAYYARECRVFAPVYRQITIQGILGLAPPTPAMRETAYADVRDAWRTYLRRHNRGRGVVLIGHSQGTFVLRRLVAEEVDRRPAIRRRLVSALLLGGNVLVARGRDAGGDFRRVRACRSPRQVGCVVAFSAFNAPVPAGSLFGRTSERGREVLCTNPAALRGGAGTIDPVYPSEPFAPGTTIGGLTTGLGFPAPAVRTPWIALPRALRARCSDAGGANVLQVTPRRGAPALTAQPDAGWGLHLADANVALGDLVDLVRTQARAWLRR